MGDECPVGVVGGGGVRLGAGLVGVGGSSGAGEAGGFGDGSWGGFDGVLARPHWSGLSDGLAGPGWPVGVSSRVHGSSRVDGSVSWVWDGSGLVAAEGLDAATLAGLRGGVSGLVVVWGDDGWAGVVGRGFDDVGSTGSTCRRVGGDLAGSVGWIGLGGGSWACVGVGATTRTVVSSDGRLAALTDPPRARAAWPGPPKCDGNRLVAGARRLVSGLSCLSAIARVSMVCVSSLRVFEPVLKVTGLEPVRSDSL